MLILSYLAIWIRGMIAVVCIASGDLVAACYGIAELVVLTFTCVNYRDARLDRRRLGQLVPILYLVGYVVVPTSRPTPPLFQVLGLFHLTATIYAVFTLGKGYTAGVHSWRVLVDRGPYRLVRHPLLLLGIVGRVIMIAAHFTLLNLLGGVLFLLATLVVLYLEETFLHTVPEWSRYAKRVKWRLLPGVW